MTIEEFKAAVVAEYRRLCVEFNGGVDHQYTFWSYPTEEEVWQNIVDSHIHDGAVLGPLSLRQVAEVHYYG